MKTLEEDYQIDVLIIRRQSFSCKLLETYDALLDLSPQYHSDRKDAYNFGTP
jgi:hypothetical protein